MTGSLFEHVEIVKSQQQSPEQAESLELAAQAILAGGVIACPTEAVYGLSCLPTHQLAVQKLIELKKRPLEKSFIIAAASISQLHGFVETETSPMIDEISASWPGPVTWILPAHSQVPAWLCGESNELAVRVTAHPVLSGLCSHCGPLISTSANLSGVEPARSAEQVHQYFPGLLDYVLDGKLGASSRPSEIRHGRDGSILRPG